MSYTAQYWLLSNRCALSVNEIPILFRLSGLADLLPIEEKAYAKVSSQNCRRARTVVLGQERAVYSRTISMVKLCGRGNLEGWSR
jgi:hypothetical protein